MSLTFFIAAASAALCGLYIGYDIGVMSGVLAMPASKEYFQWKNDFQKGFVASSFLLGALISSTTSGHIADRFGRRMSIIAASIVFLIGGALQTAATKLSMLYAGRIVAGLAIGITYAVVPLYHSEISPKTKRGAVIFFKNVAITFGMFSAYIINYGVSHLDGTIGFRVTLAIQLLPAFLVIIGMLISPSSPRWLMYTGHEKAARESLAKFRNWSEDDFRLITEIEEIKESCEQQKTLSKTFLISILKGNMRKRVLLSLSISLLQQMSGVNTITYYAPDIMRISEFTDSTEQLSMTIGNGATALLFCIVGVFLVDRVGRKALFAFGGIMMGLSMLILAILLALITSDSTSRSKGYGVLAMQYAFNAFYAFTWGPTPWVYVSEICPQHIRAKVLGISTTCSWLINFTVTQLSPYLIDALGWGIFAIYAGICILGGLWEYFVLVETKNKSLEEIGDFFTSSTISTEKSLEQSHA
ncbi:general substrate transporter [Syncephalis fuscata]|nr:general substrate transporter [Syncephalis fuscata]